MMLRKLYGSSIYDVFDVENLTGSVAGQAKASPATLTVRFSAQFYIS